MHSVTKKLNKDSRSEQLIDATMSAIESYGLSKITLAKVAKLANLSPGIVNFYFKTKQQLLLETLKALVEEYDQTVTAKLAANKDSIAALAEYIDNNFHPDLFNSKKAAVWYSFWGESQARQEYIEICGDSELELGKQLLKHIENLCSSSGNKNLNANALARGLEGLIDGYWQELLYTNGVLNRDDAKQTCHAFLASQFAEYADRHSEYDQQSINSSHSQTTDLLAPWTYQNKAFFELEVEQLFKRSWLLAGHVSDAPNCGDYLTFDAVGERAFVIRNDKNELLAFHNVCRHRGARVLKEPQGSCSRSIVCPFHGWTYRLDGSLKNLPAANTFENLDKRQYGLVPLEVEIWQGFIFLRFTTSDTSVADMLQPILSKIEPYQLESIKPYGQPWSESRPYNWKVVHDIDNEGYHVPIGHPSLQQLYGQNYKDCIEDGFPCSYGVLNDKPAALWSVKHYQNILPRFENLPTDKQRLWFYVGVFPNLVFSFFPEMVEIYMTLPKSPQETVFISRSYALPDNRREVKLSRYLNQRINRTTDTEDKQFVEWIQEGMKSSVFPQPTLSSRESGVRDFHKMIQTKLPVANLMNPPRDKNMADTNTKMSKSTCSC